MVLSILAGLRPIDVLVVAKLAASKTGLIDYGELAASLEISRGSGHGSIQRLIDARLVSRSGVVMSRNAAEMFAFGVRYFIPADLGPETGGMPTSFGVDPLREIFGDRPDIPVWPSPLGDRRGPSVMPVYETVPEASAKDPELYKLLALIDAVRVGRAREVALARAEIAGYFEVSEW